MLTSRLPHANQLASCDSVKHIPHRCALCCAQPTDTEAALLPALCRLLAGCGELRSLRLDSQLLPSACGPLAALPLSLRSLRIGCLFGAEPAMQPALSRALSRCMLSDAKTSTSKHAGGAYI